MPNNLSPVLWFIPIIALITIGLLLWLNRFHEQRAREELKGVRTALRRLQSSSLELELQAQSYTDNDPEPYRTLVVDLQRRIVTIRAVLQGLERRYIKLGERFTSYKHKPGIVWLGMPFAWVKLRKDAGNLEAESRSIVAALDLARDVTEKLRALPWVSAQQARSLAARMGELSSCLERLSSGGLYGDTFEAVLQQEKEYQATIAQIPEIFLQAPEDELVLADPRQDTIFVYELVKANSEALKNLLDTTLVWENEFNLVQHTVVMMDQELEQYERSLSSAKEKLDLSEEKKLLGQMRTIGENLKASVTRLEIETMRLVTDEAERVRQAAQEDRQALISAEKELSSLEMLVNELGDGFRDLSLQLATLAARSIHPVKWEVSQGELAELNRQCNALEEKTFPRTPAQVSEDFKSAAAILARQKEIEANVRNAVLAHGQLSDLLQAPELTEISGWIQSTRSLLLGAGSYGHENWGGLVDFSGLSNGIDSLEIEVERLITRETSVSISELHVSERLAEVRQLVEKLQGLKAEVAQVQARFDALRRFEQEAGEQIEELQKSLSQTRLIATSNPFLKKIAVQDIDRLLRSTEDLQTSLGEPERGSVENKARQVAALTARATDSASRWLALLDRENQTLLKSLSSRLAELDQIAHLEDQSVLEAARLLSSQKGDETTAGHEETAGRFSFSNLIVELKQRSSVWQECSAAAKALEEVLPLIEAYRISSEQREAALRNIMNISGWEEKKRTWPPSAARLEAEHRDLEHLEAEWTGLKGSSAKAIALVGQYSSLAARYQNLADKVSKQAELRKKQQAEVEELDSQIAEQAAQWENLRAEHSNSLSARDEIDRFLVNLDRSLQDIEDGYLRGELEYEDVIHQMTAVLRRVRFFQVALDDDHALDVNGRVLRRQ